MPEAARPLKPRSAGHVAVSSIEDQLTKLRRGSQTRSNSRDAAHGNLTQNNGLTSIVGQQVCSGGKCATIDQSAILMACQFGCGSKGKLANYVASGDCNARNVKDGNGVSVCTYLLRGAGYDVSCFTGQQSNVCVQTPTGPGDFPTSTGIASNPPSASTASIIVGPTEI